MRLRWLRFYALTQLLAVVKPHDQVCYFWAR